MKDERSAHTARFEALAHPAAKGFAGFARGNPGAKLPCWAEIAERFEQAFDTDEARIVALAPLIDEGDARPLALFVRAYRDRPAVLAALVQQASRLPVSVQCVLAVLDEAALQLIELKDSLAPEAQQLLDANDEQRKREREVFEARAERLLVARGSGEPVEQESEKAKPGGKPKSDKTGGAA